MSELVEVRDVSKIYNPGENEVRALDHVSLSIGENEFVAIIGQSGSGKSTLIRMMAGLRRPSSGDIVFRGQSIVGRRESELAWLRRGVQLVFQDPRSSLDPRMKVADIIAEPLRSKIWKGTQRPDPASRVVDLMARVGLEPADRNRYPHQFSGGQRQRIAIARALAPSPQVLIADEAVSALDVSVRAQVLNLFGELVADQRLTLIFVSHDLSVVRHMCDAVLVMHAGRIVEAGPIEQIYLDPQHSYTRQLIASVPRLRRG